MIIEKTLDRLGLVLPDLKQLYRTNPSGAKFVSHVAVQNVLYLSGTVPLKDGKPFRQGFLGKDLTVADGQEAARYAALVSLGAMKYALGDLDRVERIIQVLGFVNSRSEEHTSELQSRLHLVCRLLLEKKKNPRPACSSGSSLAARASSPSSTPAYFSSSPHL